MRTASIALLLSLSLTAACSSSDADDVGALQDETPAAAASTPTATAPSPPSAAPSAAPTTPAPAAPQPENDDAGAAPPPASDAGSPATPDGSVVVVIGANFAGRIVATLPESSCTFYLDGAYKGTLSTLDVTVPIGDHEVRCDAGNGRIATALVTVSLGETESITMELPPVESPGPGTLVAVAVGGYCTFSVNGASKGTSSQLKLTVPPGTYSVSCKPATGAQKTRSVIIKPGQTAMAMFKLQS